MARHHEATQLCLATSPLAVATMTAALDSGLLGPPRPRVLLALGHVGDTGRFDRVIDWSEEFRPLAEGWMPRTPELPLLERWLNDRWHLGGCDLVLDAVASGPGRSLAALLSDSAITVCSATLEGYGPTPELLPDGVGSRIERVLYLDFFPGLVPLLLHEYGVPYLPVRAKDVRAVLEEGPALPRGAATAWIVAEDAGPPYAEQVRALAARGFRRAFFGPGPIPGGVARAARDAGIDLASFTGPAGRWAAATRPDLTVGRASTDLAAAAAILGLPAASYGAGDQHTTAAALADTLLPRLLPDGTIQPAAAEPPEVGALLRALAYTEQTGTLPELRDGTVRYLGGPAARHRYFAPDRLAELDLPGPRPPGRVRRLLRSDRP